MKIAYCISGLYNSGGMERVLTNKVNYLANLGHEVSIITTDQQDRSSYFALSDSVYQYDLGINYGDSSGRGILRKTMTYLQKQKKHKKRLGVLLKKLSADIVISMFDHEVAFVWQLEDGSKKIAEVHFSRFKRLQYDRSGLWKLADKIRSWQDLRWARKYDRFVVLTEEDRGYWGDLGNIAVIPNANSFVARGQADTSCRRAIAVGRYDHQKGFDELIRLWKAVHERCPGWHLDIFGQGPLQEHLQAQIRDLDLGDTVRLCAPVEDIEKEYCRSGLLVMTSRYEGLPMALLEAQSCGVPMVAYACKCGPRDIIRQGDNGFLIEDRDEHDMTARLIQLMENDVLRADMGSRAKEMSSQYSEEKVMGQWLELFKQLDR